MQARIFEMIGICLVPDMSAKSFFIFQGVPDSGKSALATFIRGCFNKENTVAQDVLVLGERFAASALIGKQLCTSMDLPSSTLNDKAVSIFKMLTGGDPITADVKYRPAITFLNRAKFILGTNHPVLTQSPDPAFFRRLVAIPFAYTVPKDAQDFHLQEKLRAERSAIVYDAIRAYWRLRENRYQFSGNYPLNAVVASGAPAMQLSLDNMVEDFLRNSCQIQEGAGTFIRDLHAAFDAQHPGLLAINTFSEKLLAVCEALDLPVKRGGRKRPKGEGKLIANVIGLTLK